MLLFYIFIIGLTIGSFLNVLIDRLPNDEHIWGRSYCDHCKKQLKAIDLIPIFSFIFLRGRCRFCGKKINPRNLLVELLTASAFLLGFIYLPSLSLVSKVLELAVLSCFIAIFFADLKYKIIPDQLLIAAAIFGLVMIFFEQNNLNTIFYNIRDGLILALPIYLIYTLSGRRAMGFGDVKLSGVIGLIYGLNIGFIAIYLAFVIGALVGLPLILLKKKKLKSKIAFGPFIIIGLYLALLIDKTKLFVIPFLSN